MLAKKIASISFSAFLWCFTCVFLFPPVFHCGCWCPGYQLQTFCPKWNCQGFVLRLSPISSFLTHCFQLFPAKHFDRFPSKKFLLWPRSNCKQFFCDFILNPIGCNGSTQKRWFSRNHFPTSVTLSNNNPKAIMAQKTFSWWYSVTSVTCNYTSTPIPSLFEIKLRCALILQQSPISQFDTQCFLSAARFFVGKVGWKGNPSFREILFSARRKYFFLLDGNTFLCLNMQWQLKNIRVQYPLEDPKFFWSCNCHFPISSSFQSCN